MGRSVATCGIYTLVGSLQWIMRVLNSQGSRLWWLHHPSSFARVVFLCISGGNTVCLEIPLRAPPPPQLVTPASQTIMDRGTSTIPLPTWGRTLEWRKNQKNEGQSFEAEPPLIAGTYGNGAKGEQIGAGRRAGSGHQRGARGDGGGGGGARKRAPAVGEISPGRGGGVDKCCSFKKSRDKLKKNTSGGQESG